MPLRSDLTEKDHANPWYFGGSHWGEGFIERLSAENDPEWERLHINGLPMRRIGQGFTFKDADTIVKEHNATLGITDNTPPWLKERP